MHASPHVPPPIDARSLAAGARRLWDRRSRLVGWGSGSVFDYFHSLYPLRLDYLVDSDASRWGQTRHGIDIVSPDRLRQDAGPDTFIIIYSGAWPEIQRAIGQIGAIASLPASAAFADAATRARLESAEAIAHAARPRRVGGSEHAIVIQGPVVPHVTPTVVRAMSALYPRDALVLSTWTDADPDIVAALSPWVDAIVTSERPDTAGVQNRNFQIVSTLAGIDRAMALGARTILKTRTDLAVLDEDVFRRGRWWLDRLDRTAARAAGLSDRILVPSSFTRKYLLYHPSDMVMFGQARDLQTFWSAPLDARGGSLLSSEWIDTPLTVLNMSGHPAESYLGLEFCRSLKRPAAGTLEDSWAFYRDLFAVVDNDWFDLLWLKNLAIPDVGVRSGPRQTVSHAFWQRLQYDLRDVREDAPPVDPQAIVLREMVGASQ
jgi:hypothetical protein